MWLTRFCLASPVSLASFLSTSPWLCCSSPALLPRSHAMLPPIPVPLHLLFCPNPLLTPYSWGSLSSCKSRLSVDAKEEDFLTPPASANPPFSAFTALPVVHVTFGWLSEQHLFSSHLWVVRPLLTLSCSTEQSQCLGCVGCSVTVAEWVMPWVRKPYVITFELVPLSVE